MTAVRLTEGPDVGAIAHFGAPSQEGRTLERGEGIVDLSHRDVLTISGPDRLDWLHSLTTQYFTGLQPGVGTSALVLSPKGHIEHAFSGVDDGETFFAHTEPGMGQALVDFLDGMRFMRRVEVALRTAEYALVWQPGEPSEEVTASGFVTRRAADSLDGFETFVPRERLDEHLSAAPAVGLWAYEARRIAAGVPRFGVDTDHRTIPNEIGVLETAVHLDKGCYRGQETVARVHTLGKPPRRLVLLHLDGSVDALPETGSEVRLGERVVGRVGSNARHHELGPIALALVKRNTAVDATLDVGEFDAETGRAQIAASQEVLVDPEVGLHVRPLR